MSELKPGPCKKCGSKDVGLSFKAGSCFDAGFFVVPVPERMEARCNNCGYVWIVKSLDDK